MKRLLTCVLTVVLLLVLAVPASADMLWTPINDAFFEKHYEECTVVGRGYRANGAEGFVTVWNAPDSSAVIGQFENGTLLTVAWLWEDWGCVNVQVKDERSEGYEWLDGWVPMAELSLIYDHIAFAEEYADQIKPYNGEFADFNDEKATVNFYAYPGSESIVRSNFMFEYDTMELLVGTKDSPSYIQSVFVDEQGLTWGFIGYMRGRMNAWFCLDDPGIVAGEGVPVRDTDAPELIPAQPPQMPAKGYIPYVLVGGVVLVTGTILTVFFRKKKKTD